MSDKRSPVALYNDTAQSWVRHEPTTLSDFTCRPAVLAMCEPLSGKSVLDLGCGEGYCARRLKLAGAGEVLGLDISDQMIAAAVSEERREPLGITFVHQSATAMNNVADESFDVVLAVFLFNYLTLEETQRACTAVRRVLRPGGRFVLAVPHPAFPYMRVPSPPFFFETAGVGYFEGRNTRYAGKIWKRDGSHLEVQLVHKTLEDYFAALGNAGFLRMPKVRELRVTQAILAIDPDFFGSLGDAPLHMVIAVDREI